MTVLLIAVNTERINLPVLPLGSARVAAAVQRAGHEVVLLNLMLEGEPAGAIRRAVDACRPDVIGLSIRNVDDQNMADPRFLLEPAREVVRACRAASKAPIVVGGAGYTIFAGPALSFLGADVGVRGEGELVFPALLARIARGQRGSDLPGLCMAGRPVAAGRLLADDLDELPTPAAALWPGVDPGLADLWVPIQSRRGCPLDCSYCSTASIEGRSIRMRSPHVVAGELAGLARRGFRRFYFVDNTFNRPAEYALALCREIARLRLHVTWRCILYPHEVSEELADAMAAAGCVEASLGFESGNEGVLRAMNKQFGPADVRRVSDLLRARGIRRDGFLLVGGPGETMASVEESVAFAHSLQLDSLKVTVGIRIYPGTPLAKTAVHEGIISPDDNLLRPRFYLARELKDQTERLSTLAQA